MTPVAEAATLQLRKPSHLHNDFVVEDGESTVATLHLGLSGVAEGGTSAGRFTLSRGDRHGNFAVADATGRLIANFGQRPKQLLPTQGVDGQYSVVWIGALPDEARVLFGDRELVRVTQNGPTGWAATVEVTAAGRADSHLDVLLLLAVHAYAGRNGGGASGLPTLGSGTFVDDPAPPVPPLPPVG